MSSNDQSASASPEHAAHQRKVCAPSATSDTVPKVQLIDDEPDSLAIVETKIKGSPDEGVPTNEKQNLNSNLTKNYQSPKDGDLSPHSPKIILSSPHAATTINTNVDNNYQSIDRIDRYVQDSPDNQDQDVSFSTRHTESPENSLTNSTGSYANRNINDLDASLSGDNTGQTAVSRYRPQKYCAVCGDKAIACNFNAVTCESCKAFFRRNAFKEQRLKCLFDGRCVVDKVTRRFCSKCRLLKCFQIGMKREWILTDEQKQIKRVKILQNKQSKQQQVSTSVLDVVSRSRADSVLVNESAYQEHSVARPKSDSLVVEEDGYAKRQRTSSLSNYVGNIGRVQKCDASTSCPDEADLLSGQILHHCTMVHQCQYCSLRLQSNGQQLHPVDHYQTNYRFHSSHRPYFEYNQRQDYHQQQTHFRYSQHAGHHYLNSQTNSNAYSQHQMAAAAALKTSADVMNAAYAANMANGSATDVTQPPASASQQAMPSVACAVPPAASNCCCPSFNEIFHTQHYSRPTAGGNPTINALPVINHFANQSPTHSSGSCSSNVVYPCPRSPTNPQERENQIATKSNSGYRDGIIGVIESAMSSTDPSPDNLDLHSTPASNGDSMTSANPFVKSVTGQRTSSKAPSTYADLVASESSALNQKEAADSSTSSESAIVRPNEPQNHVKSEDSGRLDVANSIDTNKLAVNKEETLPDGSPIDISKHVVWNGIVYAQPAITESEMRARVEMIDFTETERQLVYEMIDAIKFMFEPTPHDRSFNNESLNDFVYFCDAALRRLIKTVKQIRAFRILGMDDQIMLLKTACFKILLLRSCLHYHDDIEGWRDRHGRIMPLSLLKKAKSMVYDKHKEILTKLSGPLRKDRLIMGFMSLVLLFDPQDNLKHTNSVGLDNLIYLCILRKYLIGTQPDPLEKYERLVEATQVINACNEEYNVFFSCNFQPEQITPLLIEIFDISLNNSV